MCVTGHLSLNPNACTALSGLPPSDAQRCHGSRCTANKTRKKLFFFRNILMLPDATTTNIYETAPCKLQLPYTEQNIYRNYNTCSHPAHMSRSKINSFPESFVLDRYLANILQKQFRSATSRQKPKSIGSWHNWKLIYTDTEKHVL